MLKTSQAKFWDYAQNLQLALKRAKLREYIFCGTILILGISLSYLATHQTTIIVPYNLAGPTEVAIHKISKEYLAALAAADANLYFNHDPANIKLQSALLLQRVYPNIFGATQQKLLTREQEVIKNNYAQVFYPNKYFIKPKSKEADISGKLVTSIAEKVVKTEQIILHLRYYLEQGYVYIGALSYRVEQ